MATDDLELSESNVNKLATAIAQGIAATAPKKVTAGQYDPKTPWQPDKRKAHKLAFTCYQNGYRIPPKRLNNAEIDFLNRIVRSGRYINRIVEVAVWDEGGNINLDIRYSNRTADQKLELKNHWRSFEELVRKIVEEQDAILAKQKRTQDAVNKILAQEAETTVHEQKFEDDTDPETRIESVAQTPRQEAAEKRTRRQSFSSAATRKARAEAGA